MDEKILNYVLYKGKKMIKQLWNKKSFHRIFLNTKVENLDIENTTILDIGGGEKKSSYHAILINKGNKFISIDVTDNCDIKVNLEVQRLPFEDNSQDIVFCFNVMEHIFNYQNLLDEIYRVLKKDGKFYFYVPFLVNKHADPYDYFRFTDNALIKLFTSTGFKDIEVKLLSGSGRNIHSSISWIISNNKLLILGNIFNIVSGISFYLFDKLLNNFEITKKINKKYILGIYMECYK